MIAKIGSFEKLQMRSFTYSLQWHNRADWCFTVVEKKKKKKYQKKPEGFFA